MELEAIIDGREGLVSQSMLAGRFGALVLESSAAVFSWSWHTSYFAYRLGISTPRPLD
jgi:hypothetical protein